MLWLPELIMNYFRRYSSKPGEKNKIKSVSRSPVPPSRWRPYLLVLLKLQLNGRLDAVAGVLVGLLQRQVHQVFVVRSCQVPTDEDDDVR